MHTFVTVNNKICNIHNVTTINLYINKFILSIMKQ